MARRVLMLITLLLSFVIGAGAYVARQSGTANEMEGAANRLLVALDAAGRAKVTFPFDSEERFNWHFIPRERNGVPLKEMSPAQREAAFRLLKTGLSASGFTRAETIRSLELVLRAMEKRDSRDPEMYFITIFGRPGDASWGWRYEGHHLSQNWTIVRGKAISTSPAFFGAHPAEVMDGDQKGTRALPQEADLAWALLGKLSEKERSAAIVPGAAPTDIITANSRKAMMLDPVGLLAADMSAATRAMLTSLIEAHATTQSSELSADRLAKIKAAGIEKVRFAWIGATEKTPGGGHYYRIQGPTFLIEYDNTQNRANHQHIVWRDFNGDFGQDLLALHYEQDHKRK